MSPERTNSLDPGRGRILARFTWIAAALLVLGALAFFGIADEVMEGDTLQLDQRILLALRVPGNPDDPIGPPWVEETFRDFTGLGGVGVLGLLTAATLGYLLLMGQRRAALYLALAILGGLAVSLALKAGFHRPRPDLVSYGSMVYTSSFPSGHSMLSAIVYLTGGAMLAMLHRRRSVRIYILGCALLATLLVGISRVYLGVHWPTDVLAGWAGGGAWAALCWLVARRIQIRNGLDWGRVRRLRLGQTRQHATGELLRKRQPIAREPTVGRQDDLIRPFEHHELTDVRGPTGTRTNDPDRHGDRRFTEFLTQLGHMRVIRLHRTFGDAMSLDQDPDTEHWRIGLCIVVVAHRHPEPTAAEFLTLGLANRGAVDLLDVGLGQQCAGIDGSDRDDFGCGLAVGTRQRADHKDQDHWPDSGPHGTGDTMDRQHGTDPSVAERLGHMTEHNARAKQRLAEGSQSALHPRHRARTLFRPGAADRWACPAGQTSSSRREVTPQQEQDRQRHCSRESTAQTTESAELLANCPLTTPESQPWRPSSSLPPSAPLTSTRALPAIRTRSQC